MHKKGEDEFLPRTMSHPHSLKEVAPYALLPIPPLAADHRKDCAENFHWEMSLAHNIFVRGLNSIWLNAPLVKPKDEAAFAGYCLACITTIHAHHYGEEAYIFPVLQTKLDMKNNEDQHKAFHDGMEDFESYMIKVQKKQGKYNSEQTRQLLRAFGDDLVQYLNDEVGSNI